MSFVNFCLKRTLDMNETQALSATVDVVRSSFYVDDCLLSSKTAESAKKIVNEIVPLLKSGGFKWRVASS